MATGGNGSDEFINFKCCICANKNITTEAENYCVECQDYYCVSCTDLHKLFPSAIGVHQFIDKTNFSTSGAQTVLPSFPVERCIVHKSKLLDMYYADHDEIVCATCVALNHRTCQNLHSVPDELDNFFEKSAADETKLKLLAEKDKMEVIKNTKELLVTELDKYKEKAVESIKRFRKEMGAVLDTLESESIRNLEEEHMKIRESLEDEIKVAKNYIAELQLSGDKISKSFGNKAQEFVCVKVAKRTIFETLDSEKILTKTVNVNIEFTANPKIKYFLNELKTFGIVPDPAINKPKTTLYEVDCKRQINIRQANDKATCNIYGSCFTADGLLLLADYSNKKLKCVDLCSKKVKDYLDLEASPADVCQTGKDKIAVSLLNSSIQFVSLENKMTTAKLLKLDYYCWGLAYKDGKLFVTDCGKSLYIHDMNGSMLHKITTDQQGKAFFQSNRHISLSSDGDMIYIADYNKGVITLNLQENYESTCTDTDLFHIWGVCTDGRGNIFTCGFGMSNVVQVNEKSRYKTGVLGNVKNSTSACFDPQQNKLVVTPSDIDIVEVYELV
ncbi:uncharacterized protein LOC123562567 [Mercenaria mercenaria]|uniref:uncharacterized protein LOC123562567 n=1 Tax=Mercenaria mercenaria TaxID=6596 RepID=UPI00234E96D5|nr:uncharacterized protein LOC123562567 [Mercenaria mercenaria]